MIKEELIEEIAFRTGVEKVTASVMVEAFMAVVKEQVAKDDVVTLRGFGSFSLKHRAAKTGRNISRNVTIDIPERFVPYFKPSKNFLEKE